MSPRLRSNCEKHNGDRFQFVLYPSLCASYVPEKRFFKLSKYCSLSVISKYIDTKKNKQKSENKLLNCYNRYIICNEA